MKIYPCCSYKVSNYSSFDRNKPHNKSGECYSAAKQTESHSPYYEYLKNSVLFKGKGYKKPRIYLSSKYLFIPKSDSILRRGEKLRPDKTDYTREEIKNILSEKTADECTAEYLTNYVSELISENNPDSQYIKKL